MAAPDYVPIDPTQQVRGYSSPPRRPDPWLGDRPGEIGGPQPTGRALGTAGPDQGYAYKLVHLFDEQLSLGAVHREDAVAGCVAIAMKRSALFGRAPVVHDLRAAFTVYGFLDPDPPAELVEVREELFAEVASGHHYFERRNVVDRVDADWLRKPHDKIAIQYQADWTELFVE
ncbi:MAG: hypothetical protein AAGA93_18185 [Actinomycetota bacterium]